MKSDIKAGFPCTDEELMEAAVDSEAISVLLGGDNLIAKGVARGFLAGVCFKGIDESDAKHGMHLEAFVMHTVVEAVLHELEQIAGEDDE